MALMAFLIDSLAEQATNNWDRIKLKYNFTRPRPQLPAISTERPNLF